MFPHLFQAIAATIMEENNCSLEDTYPILQKCTCSPDCMHNNKGTMQRIVKVLTDNGRINKKLLKQTIESVLNRKNISLLDGKKWMEFSLKVDQILFREGVLVKKNNQESIHNSLKIFTDYKGISLWLYYLTFECCTCLMILISFANLHSHDYFRISKTRAPERLTRRRFHFKWGAISFFHKKNHKT